MSILDKLFRKPKPESTPPGTLLRCYGQRVFYLMYVETKQCGPLGAEKRMHYEHRFLRTDGKIYNCIDQREQFFVGNYEWMTRKDT